MAAQNNTHTQNGSAATTLHEPKTNIVAHNAYAADAPRIKGKITLKTGVISLLSFVGSILLVLRNDLHVLARFQATRLAALAQHFRPVVDRKIWLNSGWVALVA